MSMQSAVVFSDGVKLWTDTAIRDADLPGWPVVAHVPKAITSVPGVTPTDFHFAATFAAIGFLAEAALPAIGLAYPSDLSSLTDACRHGLRKATDAGRLWGTMMVGAWHDGPHLFLMASKPIPDVAEAFEPIERTVWFQPLPDCPAFHEGMAQGFTPQLAHDTILSSIATPYENGRDGRAGRWVAGNVIEIVVSATGVSSRVIREGIPDQEQAIDSLTTRAA